MYDLELFRAGSATLVITAPAASSVANESIDLMCWCIAPPPRVAAGVPLVPETPVVDEDDSLTVALR